MEAMAIIALFSTIVGILANYSNRNGEYEMQNQLLDREQQFQREREEWYFEHNNIGAQFNQMLDAGFNPNLAAQSLLGGTDVSAAQGASTPTAPNVNSAIQAMQSTIGQGGQSLYDLWMKQAQIENTQANTNKTEVETGLLPRDYQLRQMSTLEQIKVWNASIERMKHQNAVDDETAKLIEQQNIYYGRKSEAEIKSLQAQTTKALADASLALEQINTEKAKQENLSFQNQYLSASAENQVAQANLADVQTSTEIERSKREEIARKFEEDMAGVPITADAQKMVNKWMINGEMDKVRHFYTNTFEVALNQNVGSAAGERLGSNNVKRGMLGEFTDHVKRHENFYAPYAVPYWNPQYK